MIGPTILDLHSALADVSAVSGRLDDGGASHAPDGVSRREAQPDNLHLYALTRSNSGALLLSHTSHSSHSSHSSGSSHYSHGSHASHTSHASHVSGAHSSHVSSSSPPVATDAHGKPDLRIGTVGGALHGNNIYGSPKHQTVGQSGAKGTELRWQISVQNDAKVSDRIRVHGAKSAHGFTVVYHDANGQDVTKEVEDGTFRTPRLAHGATYRLTVVVTVTPNATSKQALDGKVKATSVLSPKRTDTVAFVARRS